MRYKDLILQKIEKQINTMNLIKHFSQRGEHIQVNETIDKSKEDLESIQTLLNNEHQS
jgi:hypothetical protein|tara:strand:+ start:15 stop:188 length:174 start_codon:yes stop_codon:yes gene_type:complete